MQVRLNDSRIESWYRFWWTQVGSCCSRAILFKANFCWNRSFKRLDDDGNDAACSDQFLNVLLSHSLKRNYNDCLETDHWLKGSSTVKATDDIVSLKKCENVLRQLYWILKNRRIRKILFFHNVHLILSFSFKCQNS